MKAQSQEISDNTSLIGLVCEEVSRDADGGRENDQHSLTPQRPVDRAGWGGLAVATNSPKRMVVHKRGKTPVAEKMALHPLQVRRR